MSKGVGDYIASRISMLKEWRSIGGRVAQVVKHLIPGAEVYVFGSVVAGKTTGASDIDILVVVPDNLSEREVYVYLLTKLEESLGRLSYVVDLHIVRRKDLGKPPYSWWLRNSVKVEL